MARSFEQTPLGLRAFADGDGDRHAEPRQRLRMAYDQLRATVEPLAAVISRSLPVFTDHSIAHADALWETASLACGDEVPINPAEAFVLGGAFLLHDLGMGPASYRDGLAALEQDSHFDDLHTTARPRLARGDPFADGDTLDRAARDQAIVDLLCLRHAEQAERLVTTVFTTSDGESFYLLADPVLRHTFGSVIGRITRSHWSDVSDPAGFEVPLGRVVAGVRRGAGDRRRAAPGGRPLRRPGPATLRRPVGSRGGLARAGRFGTRFFTLTAGEPVNLPDGWLIVDMNPDWYIPEEVQPRPRDERFADVIEAESAWDPRTWWYDTGNFGSVGLVVRSIAAAWHIDVVDAVSLMEPLHLQADGDHRPSLPVLDSDATVRVTALRMRRTSR